MPQPPPGAIDVGNAGTLMRLLPGWLAFQAGQRFTLDGDASIRRRPVDRIAAPLRQMGARIEAREDRFPPFTVHGAHLNGLTYELPVASAQVKSCRAAGRAWAPTHDGRSSGCRAATTPSGCSWPPVPESAARPTDGRRIRDRGGGHRRARARGQSTVPGDLSSAAFLITAGVLVRDSRLVLEGVGVNWTRAGFLRILERMGAIVLGELEAAGRVRPHEPVADLDVSSAPIEGTVVEAEEVPLAIDELPLVALLGCFAEGETVVRGAEELRVKESDRIATVVEGLRGLGADIEATADGFAVQGTGGCAAGGSTPTAITAWPCSARWPAWPPRRGSRWSAWRRPRSPTPTSPPTWRRSAP